MSEMLRSQEGIDDKTKAKIERISFMQEVRDLAKLKADTANLDATTQQAIMSMLQSKMQMDQMMGQGEEAAPDQESPDNSLGAETNPTPEAQPAQPEIAAQPPAQMGAG